MLKCPLYYEVYEDALNALLALPRLSSNFGDHGVLQAIFSFTQSIQPSELASDELSLTAVVNKEIIETSTRSYATNTSLVDDVMTCIVQNLVEGRVEPRAGTSRR